MIAVLFSHVRRVANVEAAQVAHVLQKLGLRDRIQAVVLAYESGVVEPGAEC
jgi:DNA-binding NarL/FixJ family response regulator